VRTSAAAPIGQVIFCCFSGEDEQLYLDLLRRVG